MPSTGAKSKLRSPGRPTRSTGRDLRARMLDAALKLFATRGIEATPLRAIARAAGVTPALLHYYFGSKPQLIDAPVAERLLPVVGELREALLRSAGDNVATIAAFVNTIFALIERHPWFPPLWAREVLCEGGALREIIVKRVAPQIPQHLEQQFRAAQKRGDLNADLDSRLLVVSLLGLTLFLAASAPLWRRIFAADDIDTEALRMHTLALLDRGITNA